MPPLGIALYAMADVARLSFSQAVKAIFPFLAVDIVALLLITYFPPLTLTLPSFCACNEMDLDVRRGVNTDELY